MQFVGAWRLLSQTERDANGIERLARGENPLGLLIYQPNGLMAVQLMTRTPSGSLDSLETALEQYLGYFGRYTVDWSAETVTHHVEGCSYAPWIGTDKLRYFRFEGSYLILSAEQITDGMAHTRVLVWERVE